MGGSVDSQLETKPARSTTRHSPAATTTSTTPSTWLLSGSRIPGVCLHHTVSTSTPNSPSPNPVNSGKSSASTGWSLTSPSTLRSATRPSGVAAAELRDLHVELRRRHAHTVSGYAPGAPACEEPWLSPCAASVFHSYQYGGTYEVTLTVTDVGGQRRRASNEPGHRRRAAIVPAAPAAAAGPRRRRRRRLGAARDGKVVPAPGRGRGDHRTDAAHRAAQWPGRRATRSTSRWPATSRSCSRSTVARRSGISGPPATGLAPGTPPADRDRESDPRSRPRAGAARSRSSSPR